MLDGHDARRKSAFLIGVLWLVAACGSDDPNESKAQLTGSGARAIAAGSSFTCALLEGGTVTCWGHNSSGQLGTGDTIGSALPSPVDGLTEVVAIAAGGQFAGALREDESVWCWGRQRGRTARRRARPPAARRRHR